MMFRRDNKPLADETAVKLTKRYAKPSEWIGEALDGAVIYIVASHRSLLIALAADMASALRLVKDGDCMKVPSGHWDNAPNTDSMLEATGLRLDCEVQEKISGEIL